MIKVKVGDVLDVCPGVIVHGCNSKGVMGSGVAKSVKDRYPQAFQIYREGFEKLGPLKLGTISWTGVGPLKFIVNAITQETFGYDGKLYTSYDAVRDAFKQVNIVAKSFDIGVHFPLIGCDRGGGDWDIVSRIIDEEIEDRYEKVLWVLSDSDSKSIMKRFNNGIMELDLTGSDKGFIF